MKGGRAFVCGDIHGCVEALMLRLRLIGFDKSCDHLYALGDLVDRGPDSAGAMALLDEPWFDSIQGNHEVLMIEAQAGNAEMHIINGGGWFSMLNEDDQHALAEKAARLPVAMTVTTPTGRKIGLVHADIPGEDWDEFMMQVETPQVADYAQWTRGRARLAMSGHSLTPIANVDHVYFGHTPLKEPIRAANMSWIDTGCFATGRITVEELI